MKYTRKIVFVFLLACNFFAFGQKHPYLDYYNDGIKMFHKKKYKLADSLFNLSLKIAPTPETYYNIGLTKFRLKDTCAFCRNMKYASDMYDTSAIRLYNKRCVLKTVKYFDNSKHPDSLFYVEVTKYLFNHAPSPVSIVYYIRDKKSNLGSQYAEPMYDVMRSKDQTIVNSFPDYTKLVSEIPETFPDLSKFETDAPIFTVVEVMPQYPGGDEARIKFLIDNMHYPAEAMKNGIQGTVYITFVVETDGSVSNVKVLRGVGSGLEEEAMRVVNLMPKWTPGTQSGKAVRVQFNMPIRFSL